ncbi:hypothetical protein QFZ22_006416 [Streptomyces canus]|uniref:Uncharacterized protein n=1 Tax=Streptomyces canus TaxID=58343 RepID=A0AAW8FJX7_9ACTN|nr:hypothetical protein [Streptomyces canus]MDQ0910431.1 hypothetical protein [Streptomyces canus]
MPALAPKATTADPADLPFTNGHDAADSVVLRRREHGAWSPVAATAFARDVTATSGGLIASLLDVAIWAAGTQKVPSCSDCGDLGTGPSSPQLRRHFRSSVRDPDLAGIGTARLTEHRQALQAVVVAPSVSSSAQSRATLFTVTVKDCATPA